jgi:hypothetical protein
MKGLDDHPQDAPQDTGTSLGVDANLLGLLAYLFSIISGVLILVLEKRHAEVRFHAAQSVCIESPAATTPHHVRDRALARPSRSSTGALTERLGLADGSTGASHPAGEQQQRRGP